MKINQKGIDLIKHFEGLRLSAYRCPAGILTIGYGSTYYPDGGSIGEHDKISPQEAEAMLISQLNKYEDMVETWLEKYGIEDINEDEFSALVCFAFNSPKYCQECIKDMQEGKEVGIYNTWLYIRKAGGEVLYGLVKRRIAEVNLFTNGRF